MRCPRCGTPYEGNFCPSCGAATSAPAANPPLRLPLAPPAPAGVSGWPCPRCGTLYRGNFCPRCGLPAALAYGIPQRSTAGRSVLSVFWTIGIVLFLILAVMAYAGLLLAPGIVIPNVSGIRQGTGTNPDLDGSSAGWAFVAVGASVIGTYENPSGDGYLQMSANTLPGTNVLGYWWQSFNVTGSRPFFATIQLDVSLALPTSASGTLRVFVESAVVLPAPSEAIGTVSFAGPSGWTTTPRFVAPSLVDGPGTYYALLAFSVSASGAGSPTIVDFDDIHVRWATDAGVVLYLAVPEFQRFFVSQDPAVFLAYFSFLVALIVAASAFHAVRDRKAVPAAFTAPIEAVGARLRSKSAWIAIAQVFLAVNFFQFVVIVILLAFDSLPASPIDVTQDNLWVILYELANASVYEEFAFRIVLLGVPLAVGSFVLRLLEIRRSAGAWRGRMRPPRRLAGSLRYLVGGNVNAAAPKETLLVASVFLLFSATIFGLAHEPGWGWWKVAPSLVAGLGFGYLFLRHGVTAAILAHFVNDYAFTLVSMEVGGIAFAAFVDLLYLGLAVAGSGFLVWYTVYAWRHLRTLWRRFFGVPVRPTLPPVPAASVGAPIAMAPNPAWPSAPGYPLAPSAATGRDSSQIPSAYAPTYRPPPYGYPPVRFQCPACGWVEARYDAGRFTCVRCGTTS